GNVYRVVWEPLLRGKFGPHAESIGMPWMWARLHCRTTSLGYMRGGFQQLYEALVERIRSSGGEVRLGAEVRSVGRPSNAGALRAISSAGEEEYGRVVSTLAPRLTFRLAPDLPDDFRRRFEWGTAYGAHCLILALDRQLMEEVYWLSIADPDYPFLAAVEHTNYIPPEEYGGRHLVYLGNYLPIDHPTPRAPPQGLLEQDTPPPQRPKPAFSREWVRELWGFAAPYAQPIVTVDYKQHIPPHETPISGLYMANMFQVYPQDRGQNYSVLLANRLAQRLLGETASGDRRATAL